MVKRFKVTKEIKKGKCDYPGYHDPDFHHHVVRVINLKTGESHWRCNKHVRGIDRPHGDEIAHKLTELDSKFWPDIMR